MVINFFWYLIPVYQVALKDVPGSLGVEVKYRWVVLVVFSLDVKDVRDLL